jgi:DnaJ-class molecular chaperone
MNKHAKPCPVCNGQGWVWQEVHDRKTGGKNVHKATCPGCGGTGKG